MKINTEINYTILSNSITTNFVNKFSTYPIFESMNFFELKSKIEISNSRQIVFNGTFYNLRLNEQKEILKLLNRKNMKFINITSNIEDALYSDYIIVYDGDTEVINGKKEEVLKEEKILKKLGFGLPFVVDLSTQLQFYNILNKTYFDQSSLVGDLWN